MINKQKTIKAIEKLIWKYRNPEGQKFCYVYHCPLCDIHRGCRGCPSLNGDNGCGSYASFDAVKYDGNYEIRAIFWEQNLPRIKKVPTKRFTRSGWTKHSFDCVKEVPKNHPAWNPK